MWGKYITLGFILQLLTFYYLTWLTLESLRLCVFLLFVIEILLGILRGQVNKQKKILFHLFILMNSKIPFILLYFISLQRR